MLKTLKSKILASVILIIFICTLAFTIISIYEIRTSVTNQMKNDGIDLVTIINREVSKYDLEDRENIEAILVEIKEQSRDNIKYISVADENLQIVASSDGLISQMKQDEKENVDALSSASKERNNEVAISIQDGEPSGYIFETDNGEKVYNVSTPFYENNRLVGAISIGISLSTMNNMIYQSLMNVFILSLLVLFIAIILGIIIAKSITTPITNVIEKLDDFSKGDFTVEYYNTRNDETKRLTDALNKSIAMLRQMLIDTKQDINELGGISNYLKDSSESVESSSKSVAVSIAEIAQGTEEQSHSVGQVTRVLESFNSNLLSIQTKIEDTANGSIAIEKTADIGAEKLDELVRSIKDVRDSFNHMALIIQQLNGNANLIGEIMGVINTIAKQTNLLSLNATIEANRAGESGSGFSVVAGEIRKLAVQVMESAESINTIITDILAGIKGVSSTTSNIEVIMDKQIDIVDNTMLAFKDIQSEVRKTVPEFRNISESIKNIVEEESSITGNIEEIAAISEQIAASTHEISTSVEEHVASMEQLSSIAYRIDEMTTRLNENMDKFKISEG